jgi:hypothetical protein
MPKQERRLPASRVELTAIRVSAIQICAGEAQVISEKLPWAGRRDVCGADRLREPRLDPQHPAFGDQDESRTPSDYNALRMRRPTG